MVKEIHDILNTILCCSFQAHKTHLVTHSKLITLSVAIFLFELLDTELNENK